MAVNKSDYVSRQSFGTPRHKYYDGKRYEYKKTRRVGGDPKTGWDFEYEYEVFDEVGYWGAIQKQHAEEAARQKARAEHRQKQAEQIEAQIEQKNKLDKQNVLGNAAEEQREHATLLGTAGPALRRNRGNQQASDAESAAASDNDQKRKGGKANRNKRRKNILSGNQNRDKKQGDS